MFDPFSFYAAFALCAGVVLVLRGFRDLRLRRLLRDTPTSRIRSLAMGLVEVRGQALERSTLQAPFTGDECAFWQVEIATAGKERGSWNTVHRRSSGQPFFVTDDTGVAMLYPEGAHCTLPVAAEEECMGPMLPECYSRYLDEIHTWRRFLWGASRMRFREWRLEEGQPVTILGTAEPRAMAIDIAPADTIADTGTAEVLKATGTDGPGSTLIPPRGPARVRLLHQRVSAVIRRGSHPGAFLISAQPVAGLETSLAISTTAALAGGAVLAALGLTYWVAYACMWRS